ncbi:MAG TPA: winged helix-turn-helix domain-containing protein, partial [Streptosporangiaceae bacterium]|nr:winged helix-turn-helix domain-containing protein [Streptosporangiaceae bacterium]
TWSEDQRWTLARVTTLTGRLFHVRYTLRGTSYLLHRIGFTPQVPIRRAMERDEAAAADSACLVSQSPSAGVLARGEQIRQYIVQYWEVAGVRSKRV